jgi:hypothetical protein
MKKNLLMMALMLTMSFSSLFANGHTEINERIINSFKKEFVGAQDAQWEQTKDMVKVTFKMNAQVLFAYYSPEGTLLAVTRNIASGQLPMNLLVEIKKNYSGLWITDLFEIAMGNETSYYMTMENGDQTLILKSTGTAGWEVFKKEKKNI